MTVADQNDISGKTTGWRGSRQLWLDAARDAFVDAGLDAVKIQPLANRLGLSRTSFYWFFKDRDALLDALLDDWETANTGSLVAATDAYAETITEAVLNLIGVFLEDGPFEPRFDLAVRGWAHRSEPVATRVHLADETRLDAIRRMFGRFDYDPGEADVRARTVYLVQIGYISMQVREDIGTRMARIPDYVKTFTGQLPSDRALTRFHARHGFVPQGC
ncbi:Bacterial regulatory proteins, tetR family [Thalassovita gelatinovora]|uniref:Bacterial regulatory proteins, tetR family n=1 Tax=Thalassovita gelatinovora TaxID=53501 RepID=A0A0P1G264_THAGE|nr:TetR/AcrR family transcriptional regulator [Thalassovita gelatinovora]QIZ82150.1 TetR/AcrR family transcriptional regulator [Thalassovita gelatinovora]CUH67745.1 Bacterial regulatory proteins, tetR family [Thalassovita gelatinovora]SEP68276.1 transcriptional regulator, TetR family [Thalassovita gelatinovora]